VSEAREEARVEVERETRTIHVSGTITTEVYVPELDDYSEVEVERVFDSGPQATTPTRTESSRIGFERE
jgi:hypothetical protein